MKVRFTMPDGTVVEKDIPGIPGKSPYEYAKDGGYTGTLEEFTAKLAAEMPASLPNPNTLTINGTAYDGSTAVDMTAVINTMIDAKLATIPNASGVSF